MPWYTSASELSSRASIGIIPFNSMANNLFSWKKVKKAKEGNLHVKKYRKVTLKGKNKNCDEQDEYS